jgi:hypothetical protein
MKQSCFQGNHHKRSPGEGEFVIDVCGKSLRMIFIGSFIEEKKMKILSFFEI